MMLVIFFIWFLIASKTFGTLLSGFEKAHRVSARCTIENVKLEPTAAPHAAQELFKRGELSSTCGYISGDPKQPLTCSNEYCGYNSIYNGVACCQTAVQNGQTSLSGCGFRTQCYDSTAVSNCQGSCATNTLVLLCTSSLNPYCFTYTYTDIRSTILACGTAHATISLQNTANVVSTTNSKVTSPASASLPTWVTTTFDPQTVITDSVPKSTTITASVASSTSTKTSSHTEAIMVGVVCGSLGLLAIAGLALYLWLKK